MRFLHSRLIFLTLIIIAAITCVQLTREIMRRYTINAQIKKIQAEVKSLEAKQFELKQVISYLKSNTYVEEEARKKLNLRKVGESVYVIPGDTHATSTPARSVSVTATQGWWNYFFGKQVYSAQ